jgi:hypothetical protein
MPEMLTGNQVAGIDDDGLDDTEEFDKICDGIGSLRSVAPVIGVLFACYHHLHSLGRGALVRSDTAEQGRALRIEAALRNIFETEFGDNSGR